MKTAMLVGSLFAGAALAMVVGDIEQPTKLEPPTGLVVVPGKDIALKWIPAPDGTGQLMYASTNLTNWSVVAVMDSQQSAWQEHIDPFIPCMFYSVAATNEYGSSFELKP